MNDAFRRWSVAAANALGSPWMFIGNVFLILVWLGAGPVFGFSDTWQLVVNTATTVITYLAIFLVQNTQNRDAKAIHLKLDELITSVQGARNRLVAIEGLSDEELETMGKQFQELRTRTARGDADSVEPIDMDKEQGADPTRHR